MIDWRSVCPDLPLSICPMQRVHALLASLLLLSPGLVTVVAHPGFAQAIADSSPTTPSKAATDRALKEGERLQRANQVEAALQEFQQALQGYRSAGDRAGQAQALRLIGNLYLATAKAREAIQPYQEGLELARQLGDRDLEARFLNNLGRAYFVTADRTQALAFYEQSWQIAQQDHNQAVQLIVLQNLGQAYASKEEYTKALDYYQQALQVAEALKEDTTAVLIWQAIGYIHHTFAKDYTNAIAAYQTSLELAEQHQNSPFQMSLGIIGIDKVYRPLKINALLGMAEALHTSAQSSQDYQKAIAQTQKAFKLAQEAQDIEAQKRALMLLYQHYTALQDYPNAVTTLKQQIKVIQASENTSNVLSLPRIKLIAEGQILAQIGDHYTEHLSQHDTALIYYQQALKIAETTQVPWLQIYTLLGIANASHSLAKTPQEYQKLFKGVERALQIARETKHLAGEARAVALQAIISYSLEDFPQAVRYGEQAIALARQANDQGREALLLREVGRMYFYSLQNYAKGIEYQKQAVKVAQALQKPDIEASALMALSDAYTESGSFDQAIQVAEQLKTLAQQRNFPEWKTLAAILITIAQYGRGDGQTQVEASAQESLRLAQVAKKPTLEALALFCLGWINADVERYDQALNFTQQGLAIARSTENRSLEGVLLRLLGNIYRKQGQANAAVRAYQQALVIDKDEFRLQVGLAEAYQDLNMPITAISHYKQAIQQFQGIRSNLRGVSAELEQSFLKVTQGLNRQSTTSVYRQLADLLLAQGRILEAQEILELLKVQELRDFTRSNGSKSADIAFTKTEETIKQQHGTLIAFGKKLYDCDRAKCDQRSQLRDQLDAITLQYTQTINTLEKELAQRSDPTALNPSHTGKIRQIVEAQPDTVLIYPFVQEDKLWLLWAAKGGILKSQAIPVSQKELGQAVLQFRESLSRYEPGQKKVREQGQVLYNWLIRPIEPELKANRIKNLVFSLDRVTRYIPMAALFDGKQYLIENYGISTILSADLTDLNKRLPTTVAETPVLALGASEFQDANPLPNVPGELDAIVREAPNAPTGIYPGLKFLNQSFDFRALRDNLAGHRVLHIATHATFTPGRPEDSYLVLGDGKKLTIPEIQTLQDLNEVSLVVLSACQTALGGANQDGIEISGLSSYFLKNGAGTVLASLWLVDDASTQTLMETFYRNLAQSTAQAPVTKTEALRQAQLSLLANPSYRHPYFWAPFVLIGNGL